MTKRKYKMKQRAVEQERTRQNIVEATAALHGTVGPKNTSISAIAKKAGVQRLTVYRHFPTEESLFHACTSHWLAENPPPAIDMWCHEKVAEKRTRLAIGAIYDYYRRTSAMWRLSYRDVDEVPALQGPMSAFHTHMDGIRNDLLACWQPKGKKSPKLKATIGHAISFTTWASLEEQGLGKLQMVDLVITWIASSAPAKSAK